MMIFLYENYGETYYNISFTVYIFILSHNQRAAVTLKKYINLFLHSGSGVYINNNILVILAPALEFITKYFLAVGHWYECLL